MLPRITLNGLAVTLAALATPALASAATPDAPVGAHEVAAAHDSSALGGKNGKSGSKDKDKKKKKKKKAGKSGGCGAGSCG